MGQDLLARARQRSEELLDAWDALFSGLGNARAPDGSSFDTTIPIPGLELAIDDLSLQVSVLTAEIKRIGEASSEVLVGTPPMGRRRLEEALEKTIQELLGISQSLDKKLKSLNSESFQGAVHNPQQPARPTTINFAEKFVGVARALDDAFVRVLHLKMTLPKPKQRLELVDLVAAVRRAAMKGNEAFEEASRYAALAEKNLSSVNAAASEVEELLSNSREEKDKIQEIGANTKNAMQEVVEGAEKIKEIVGRAESLEDSVEEYQPKFEKFQKTLVGYEENIRAGGERQAELLEELSRIELEINDKNSQASDMLSHATVAGLAASFGSTRDKLGQELKGARRVFYISIVVLVLLALPMVLYILPGAPWGGPALDRTGTGLGGIFAEVMARVTILLPGVLFVGFASRRHSSLFRLREHYEYKYNMAASVEGFKLQAADIADAIAGTTFYELLTRNPADAMDGGKVSMNSEQQKPLVDAVRRHLTKKGRDE